MTTAAPVRIRIGASLDLGSVEEAFGTFEKRADRAAKSIGRTLSGKKGNGLYQDLAKDAENYAQRAEAAHKRGEKAAQTEAQKSLEAFRKAAAAREKENSKWLREMGINAEKEERARNRAAQRAAVEAERLARKASSAHEREAARLQAAEDAQAARFAQRTSHRFTRFMAPNLPIASMARRVGADVLRGVGLDASISGTVARARDMESAAIELSNQGYMPGAVGDAPTANSRRVDASALVAQSREIGDAYSIDPQKALAGMAAFVTKTGDLATARAIIKDMARLAGATGAELESTADAAGDVASALDPLGKMDTREKAASIFAVMRMVAGQGKIGSVELKQLAAQEAKIASASTQFEGDRAENIVKLGALAQISRSLGGSSSAAMAATSVAGFANTLKTKARVSVFEKYLGKGALYNDQGLLRDPIQILKASIAAAGTGKESPIKLKEMWGNVMGARAVEGLATTYRSAGGGKSGMEAIDKLLGRFLQGAAISNEQIDENLAKRSGSTASKAQRFQNQLDRIAESSLPDVIEAFQQLAPIALQTAKGLASVVSFSANHPGLAIAGGMGVSAARAGIESAMRTSLERSMLRNAGAINAMAGVTNVSPNGLRAEAANGGKPGKKPGITAGGALAATGTGLMIGGALAAEIYGSGVASFDSTSKSTAELSRGLVGLHGADLGLALAQARTKRDEIDSNRGFFEPLLNLFGGGSEAEIAGLDELIARKSAEYERYRSGKETASDKAERLKYRQDVASGNGPLVPEYLRGGPDAIGKSAGQAVANALGQQTLTVRVINMPENGLGVPRGREAE